MAIFLLFMVMPVIVWFPVTLFAHQPINSSDALKRKYLFICGILMFLMLACRHYSVGSGDGIWYYNSWSLLGNMSFSGFLSIFKNFDMESGYLMCAWILSHIFKDPQFVFVIYGLLVSVSVCRFLYKNCEDVVLGMVMFVSLGLWSFMVQGLRQGIAMCICLFAIEFCKKRKLIPYIILVTVAVLFHASAIVFAVAYSFSWLKMNVKGYFIVAICATAAMLLIDRLFMFVNIVINDAYDIGNIADTSGGFVLATIYLLIIVFSVIFFNEEDGQANHLSFFFYMALCGFITYIMRYSVNTIAQRVSYYFMFSQMIMLPAIVKRVFVNSHRAYVSFICIVLCLGIALYKASYSVLVPYVFYWQV